MLDNFLYVHDSLNKKTPVPLQGRLNLISDNISYNLRNSKKQCVKIPPGRTREFGIHSILGQAARTWNHFQNILQNENLHLLSRNQCKKKT